MRRSRQEATLLGWLQGAPRRAVPVPGPCSALTYAQVLLASGELEGVEARLRDAERWLDTTADMGERPDAPSAEMVVVDEEEFRRLPGTIAIAPCRTGPGSGRCARDRDICPAGARPRTRGRPSDARRGSGVPGARILDERGSRGSAPDVCRWHGELQKAGNISDAIGGAIALADIRIAQGRLHEAMRTYEQALQLATEQGTPVLRGTADMYVGMSELHREHNDLHAATQHLLRSKELGEHTGFPQNRYRWRVAMARIREAQGDLDGALDLLDEAERLYVSDFSPNVRPIAALKTRVWVAQGRLGEALDWAREQGLSAEDDLSYLREFEHITLARVLLARYKSDRADRSIA